MMKTEMIMVVNDWPGLGKAAASINVPILNAAQYLSLIHISEPTRREWLSRMPSSA